MNRKVNSTTKVGKRTSTTACTKFSWDRCLCLTFFLPVGENNSPPRSSSLQRQKIHASKTRISSLRMSSTNSTYTSAYRRNTPMLTYDAHPFIQTICEVDQQSGELHFIGKKEPMSILIGKGWQSLVKGGKPSGAYLSKGFTKY